MFNATELRQKAKHKTRLDCYFKRHCFGAIVRGLTADGVPPEQIMQTSKGPHGYTLLHDAFFLDFMCWMGGESYYRATKKFVTFKGSPHV